MLIREILPEEKDKFDAVATHPMQSYAWGEFRRHTGVEVLRLGLFEGTNIKSSFQITIHQVPKLGFKIGYLPRASAPCETENFALQTACQKHNLIFVKNEPNFFAPVESATTTLQPHRHFLTANNHQLGRPMFTNYSFQLDLTKSIDQLSANFKSKTRYNIKIAQNHGVNVTIDNSDQAFDTYINLWRQTTSRQGFYSHDEQYHRLMWQHMKKANIAHLMKAEYQGQTLGIWILFIFNNVLYYPYGASSREHREVMANNLLAFEAIKFGQSQSCHTFDMWGSLGPNPDTKDPWYGFHRFKEGYGGTLMEFVGSYDYVADPQRYQIFKLLDTWRWRFLRLRSKLPF